MHKPDDIRIFLPDEAASIAFADRLSGVIKPGLVIFLRGDLGAGKTTLVRALLHALGYTGRIKSPTYTLLEPYTVGRMDLRHFDLYRFKDKEEWENAGFRDEFDGRQVCLVEWPEKAHGLIPQADLEILFEILQSGRNISLRANTKTGMECISSLPG